MTNTVSLCILFELLNKYSIDTLVCSKYTSNTIVYKLFEESKLFRIICVSDDRSAGYIATGLASEINKPIALLSIDGASYRSTMPAMTEAYYRALPIVALTIKNDENHFPIGFVGHNDMSLQFKDIVKKSIYLEESTLDYEVENTNIKLNEIFQELYYCGGGPIQIRIDYSMGNIPNFERLNKSFIIPRIISKSECPHINSPSISFFIGENIYLSEADIKKIDSIVSRNDGSVYCNNQSCYYGEKCELLSDGEIREHNLLIVIGDLLPQILMHHNCHNVWYVNKDCSSYPLIHNLKCCFEMSLCDFINQYFDLKFTSENIEKFECTTKKDYTSSCYSRESIAYSLSRLLSNDEVLYVGYKSYLKYINKFKYNAKVRTNSGAMGYDGLISMALGASLVSNNTHKVFVVVEYNEFINDMNALCNRHFKDGLIVLIMKDESMNCTWEKFAEDCNLRFIRQDNLEDLCKTIKKSDKESILIECIVNS